MSQETIILVLENLVYHSTEHAFLSDLLEEKYGFTKVEDDTQEVSKEQKPVKKSSKLEADDKTIRTDVIRYSKHEKLAGDYLDANIRVSILGDVTSTHTILQINSDEKQSTYSTVYQTVRISSESGYAIEKMIDRLVVDLGLVIDKKKWSFHRVKDL
ncbi:hypothetical protein EU537_03405 [Candidatus Thorarchaeota archaeon]|nr:MAG: hypothetical protein EU537_03405 [Candidatus Thorarchaeota archaeon]